MGACSARNIQEEEAAYIQQLHFSWQRPAYHGKVWPCGLVQAANLVLLREASHWILHETPTVRYCC
jgi:hypothetical protein